MEIPLAEEVDRCRLWYHRVDWQTTRIGIFLVSVGLLVLGLIHAPVMSHLTYHIAEGLVSALFVVDVWWRFAITGGGREYWSSWLNVAEMAYSVVCVGVLLTIPVWTSRLGLMLAVLNVLQVLRLVLTCRQSVLVRRDVALDMDVRIDIVRHDIGEEMQEGTALR
jgi:hypothetical protein